MDSLSSFLDWANEHRLVGFVVLGVIPILWHFLFWATRNPGLRSLCEVLFAWAICTLLSGSFCAIWGFPGWPFAVGFAVLIISTVIAGMILAVIWDARDADEEARAKALEPPSPTS